MLFRDDWERKAHDIICIIKYGGIGGQVRDHDMREVANVLRGHSLRPVLPKVTVTIPKINGLPVLTGHDPSKHVLEVVSVSMPQPGALSVGVKLPPIKLP